MAKVTSKVKIHKWKVKQLTDAQIKALEMTAEALHTLLCPIPATLRIPLRIMPIILKVKIEVPQLITLSMKKRFTEW